MNRYNLIYLTIILTFTHVFFNFFNTYSVKNSTLTYAIKLGEKEIGKVNYRIDSEDSTKAYILNLSVIEKFKNKKVKPLLLNKVCLQLKKIGCKVAIVEFNFHDPARYFFIENGFSSYDIEDEQVFLESSFLLKKSL